MWKSVLRLSWIVLICNIFAQSLFTSIFTLGWAYRYVQYYVTKRLFTLSPIAQNNQWSQFSAKNPEITSISNLPNLFLRQKGINSPPNSIINKIHSLFHSFWLNWRSGISGILTTWSLTAIPCIIWAMAWYTGWHISFNKMYEESATGVSLGILGTVLFSLIMFYLPFAQARHGFTQDWRSFFDFRFIKTMIWQRPLTILLLAIAYTFCSIIMTIVKIMPVFFPAMNPQLESLPPTEALNFLNDYYFHTGLLAFGLLLILRTFAGRIYADALKAMWTEKRLASEAFHPQERSIFKLLQIDYGANYQPTKMLTKVVKLPFFFSYKTAITFGTFMIWSLFNFMPFVSEFFNYYPFWGFLNQPLVQLPCFRYVPHQLQQEAKNVALFTLESNEYSVGK